MKYFREGIKVLEIGPDDFPSSYKKCFQNIKIEWDTIDLILRKELTYVANNEYQFPIEDNSYDIVFSAQVIEHVRKIWMWVKELSRICKIGGYVIIINPISHPFHKLPYDCWRIYPEGMKALYSEAGLNLIYSTFRSLEEEILRKRGFRNIIYGKPCPPQALLSFFENIKLLIKDIKNFKNYLRLARVYGKLIFGYPISCSLDTITIGIKG